MRPFLSTITLAVTLALPLAAQQTAPQQAQPPINVVPPPPSPNLPSSILRSPIESIHQALSTLQPDKWKMSGATAQQTVTNITSIQSDLDTTLPKLLATADQNPASVQQVLPALRNVTALYDVLLRVTQTAIISAPTQQIITLQDALDRLEHSKNELSDVIEAAAIKQTQQMKDLQAQYTALKNTPPPPPPVCPTPAAPKKRRTTRSPKSTSRAASTTPAAKPGTTPPAPKQ